MNTFESPGFFLTLLAFLAVIGPLVFVHELGHYWVGRWCGVKVDAFSIGFGRKILGWTDRHGTVWKIGWLPLGGYVQFAGDRDAVSQPSADWQSLPTAERNRSFPAQPVWKRILIVLAGPVTNFLFAILILAGFAMAYGQVTTPPVVGEIVENSAAQKAGLQRGDRIVAIDGRTMESFADIPMTVAHRGGEAMTLSVERDGETFAVPLTPQIVKETDRFGNVGERGLIGIGPSDPVIADVSVVQAPMVAIKQVGQITRQMSEVITQLLTGNRSIKDMGGPLKIAKASGEFASLGFASFVFFAALISINLGFINLLPLPMLDGGHLVFYAYEAIRRKPANPAVQEWAFRFGFVAIALLMLVVTSNDLSSFGLWEGIARLIG